MTFDVHYRSWSVDTFGQGELKERAGNVHLQRVVNAVRCLGYLDVLLSLYYLPLPTPCILSYHIRTA